MLNDFCKGQAFNAIYFACSENKLMKRNKMSSILSLTSENAEQVISRLYYITYTVIIKSFHRLTDIKRSN